MLRRSKTVDTVYIMSHYNTLSVPGRGCWLVNTVYILSRYNMLSVAGRGCWLWRSSAKLFSCHVTMFIRRALWLVTYRWITFLLVTLLTINVLLYAIYRFYDSPRHCSLIFNAENEGPKENKTIEISPKFLFYGIKYQNICFVKSYVGEHRMKSHLSVDFMVTEWWLHGECMVTGQVNFSLISVTIQWPISRLNGRHISVTFWSFEK